MPKKKMVNMEMQHTLDELSLLFDEARSHNEFEFVMTLLNYKSIGSMELQANLHEWFEAIESYKVYYGTFSGKEKTKDGSTFVFDIF